MNLEQPFPDYELLDRVGAGAMGTVFKARQKSLSRIVALKVLKPSLARDSRYVDRLRREARIVASLSHPNIVGGHDLGEAGGYHYFVMEFVEGKSLRQLILEWGMFAEDYVRRVGQQVAAALDHAYERGVIHRDVKPGNILIDDQGNVKLTDMGLAKGPADLTLTRDGATVGTPQYISPEQARNPHDVDVRTDLYSLGATLYHMATGQPPFRGDTMAELITKVLNDAPVPPTQRNPALSEGMGLVIRKLLAKDLKTRYQTPRELLDDLDRLERSQPVAVDVAALNAEEPHAASALWRSLWVVAAAVLLAAAVWLGMQLRDREPAAPSADVWLAELDTRLAEVHTPGERLSRLREAMLAPPSGAELGLLQRERSVATALRAAVDAVAGEVLEAGWSELSRWLQDPVVWPGVARWEGERLFPLLRGRCGLSAAQLPSNLALPRLDQLRDAVATLVRDRDAALLRRFDEHLATTVPARSDERVRAGDFAAADRLWREAAAGFFDGVRAPLTERLDDALVQQVRDRHNLASQRARPAIDAAEAAVADALRGEADELARALRERLLAGAEPERLGSLLAQCQREMLQTWPAAARFRVGRDPWPTVEQSWHALEREIAAFAAQQAGQRFERQLDLVWRTFCKASAPEALRVLDLVAPQAPTGAALDVHRRALTAAAEVAERVLRSLVQQNRAVAVYARHGAVALRAEATPDGIVLWSQASDQPARRTALAEFRLGDLLTILSGDGDDPLRGLEPARRELGLLVYAMLGDDLDGIAGRLQAHGDESVRTAVWPRLLAERQADGEAWLDRDSVFARLRAVLAAARQDGRLLDVEAALLACERRVPRDELLPAERQALLEASGWLQLERRRRQTAEQLTAAAPRGAVVAVEHDAGALTAVVRLDGAGMQPDAADGWQLQEGAVLEFAGGARPWSAIATQQLRCATGLDAAVRTVRIDFDVVFPARDAGRRAYVFEFRGVAVMVALDGNDGVRAAVVDGDPRRAEPAQRAFERALQEALGPPRAVAVPRGVHRLSLQLQLARNLGRANAIVALDGVELTQANVVVDPRANGTLVILPLQELWLHRVEVRASGL
jgi:tRNA A-37 threonylcarbamoyl transferase component Bud32